MDTPPPQLEYGIAPPRTVSNAMRWLILFFIGIACYAAWQWGAHALSRSNVLYAQRRCLSYTASPEQVVYEEEPTRVAGMLKQSGGYVSYPLERHLGKKSRAAAATIPDCWRQFIPLVPRLPYPFPRTGDAAGAILFLHERTSPAGHRRLVCVRYYAETFSFTPNFIESYNIESNAITPATWTAPPARSNRPLSVAVTSGFPHQPPNVRIFAGQIDPNDPARFTIRYQMWGREDVLDGRLMDDDTVSLQPRNQPAEPQ